MSSTKNLRRELGKKELFGIAFGQVIGAGIMVLVGYGIAMTGRSVNLAMVLSGVWVILLSLPWIFISGCVRLRGGEYTQVAVLCGERFAGFYILIYLVRNLQMPIYVLAFTEYFLGLFPHVPAKAVSICIATFFFGLNIFPTKRIAQVQNSIVFVLIVALALFVAYGAPQITPGYFSKPGFMTNGIGGFLGASAFLTFATFGAISVFQLSGECKSPTTDIPFVLISSTLLVSILYGFIAMVAAGVLPLEAVSAKPLTVVAKAILSEPLYVFFIVGGALGALATSLNATIAYVPKPLIQASEDGWFPKKLSYLHPKYKTPVVLLGLFYVITIVPIMADINIEALTQTTLVLMYCCMIISSLASMRLPKIFPEQWARSPFRCSQSLLNLFCIVAVLVLCVQVYYNAAFLEPWMFYANAGMLVVAALFAHFRYATGNVKMTISYEDC